VIEFVTTPTEEWLKGALVRCKSQLLISSPYIGGWLPKLHRALPTTIRRVLLTRADMRDFASGASDLEAVCTLAGDGTEIISAHRLHAKVYVIDGACGLVTSANATSSGMRSNLECGVVLSDPQSVQAAAALILRAFGTHEPLQRWSVSELQSLREPVRRLQETLSPKLLTADIDARLLADIRPNTPLGRALREHLPGWTRLALEGVQMQQSATFSLDTFVSACMPLVSKRYPNNRNVRAKLRQQLQRLRDLGIIEFLGGGTYRRNG
jgi:hypothetical protein